MGPLILASASPRRKDLLREHGYEFGILPADVLEVAPPHLTAGEVTLRNARAKALAVASVHPDAVVLGVDTVVAFEGEIFGKPSDMDAAFAMAKRLNGRTHEVYSGVWLRHGATNRERGFVEITRVHFRRLTDAQLRAYLARVGPLDKAGAYAAQDDRGEFIASVEGSFTNVVGLPMEKLAVVLKEFRETGKRTGGFATGPRRRGDKPETGKKFERTTKKQAGAPPAF
jgi:septum formation protein